MRFELLSSFCSFNNNRVSRSLFTFVGSLQALAFTVSGRGIGYSVFRVAREGRLAPRVAGLTSAPIGKCAAGIASSDVPQRALKIRAKRFVSMPQAAIPPLY